MLVRFIRTAMGTYFIALRHKYRRRRKEGFKHARWPRLALDSSMLLKLQANNLHYRQEIIFHYTHTQIHQHVRDGWSLGVLRRPKRSDFAQCISSNFQIQFSVR